MTDKTVQEFIKIMVECQAIKAESRMMWVSIKNAVRKLIAKYIQNPSEAVQLEAVKQNGY